MGKLWDAHCSVIKDSGTTSRISYDYPPFPTIPWVRDTFSNDFHPRPENPNIKTIVETIVSEC